MSIILTYGEKMGERGSQNLDEKFQSVSPLREISLFPLFSAPRVSKSRISKGRVLTFFHY
jgi:hypothetical protein